MKIELTDDEAELVVAALQAKAEQVRRAASDDGQPYAVEVANRYIKRCQVVLDKVCER